jgi:hypothetical protein
MAAPRRLGLLAAVSLAAACCALAAEIAPEQLVSTGSLGYGELEVGGCGRRAPLPRAARPCMQLPAPRPPRSPLRARPPS